MKNPAQAIPSIGGNGRQLNLQKPVVMAILNLTPDSFYAGSRLAHTSAILQQARLFLEQGATILDLGAYSSRPGAAHISQQEELDRLLPGIACIAKEFPKAIISVDTFRAHVAQEAVKAGAHIINDIGGGNLDDQMFSTVAQLGVPYILMHMKGNPQNMQLAPFYNHVTEEVCQYFAEKISTLQSMGVKEVILDPGFGFAKTLEHNYQLLSQLEKIHRFALPILVGVSRKSMVTKLLDVDTNEALNGTTALHTIALLKGAKILRVHDVKEATEAIKIHHATQVGWK